MLCLVWASSPPVMGPMLSLLAVPQGSVPCRAKTDREKVARLGVKTESLLSDTSVHEDLVDQRPEPVPSTWAGGAPRAGEGDGQPRAAAGRALGIAPGPGSGLGSSYRDIPGTWLVLPCHLLATLTSAVGAHRGAHAGTPWDHQPAQVLSHPFPACYTQRAFPCNPSAVLPYFFYITLRPCISFFILYLYHVHSSSFCTLP